MTNAGQTFRWSQMPQNGGEGAYWLPRWFQIQWSPQQSVCSIEVLELIPAVVAAALYGKYWAGKVVQFVIDNHAVVDILERGYSREDHLMHLVRLLVFLASHYNFWFTASHIPGANNTWADAISRNRASVFLGQSPTPVLPPSQVPIPLLDLVSQSMAWTSPEWANLFGQMLGGP